MTEIRVQVDDSAARASLAAASAALPAAVRAGVAAAAALAQTTIRGLASSGTHPPGRPHIPGTGPGPNVATGDYRRSITLTAADADQVVVADVGTDAPQAARLELGFVGRDSLGRYYQAQAYPHFAPAEQVFSPLVDKQMEAVGAVIGKLLEG